MKKLEAWKDVWNRKAFKFQQDHNLKGNNMNQITKNEILKLNGFDQLNNELNSENYDRYIKFIGIALRNESITPKRLVEMGCGSGLTLNSLREELQIDGKNTKGYDYCEGLISIAKESFPDIQFNCSSIYDIKSEEIRKNDLVFANSVTQYLEKEQLRTKCIEILEKNAILMLLDVPDEQKKQAHLAWKKEICRNTKPTLHSYYHKSFFSEVARTTNKLVKIWDQYDFYGPQAGYRYNVLVR